ncbi:MAG: hypothetical protein ACYT04_36340 [Nostoc sp.]
MNFSSARQLSIDQFLAIAQQLIAKANQNPALRQVFTQFTASTPQYQINIDPDHVSVAGRSTGAGLGD